MFDVHFLSNPIYETTLPKFLFRLDWPLFRPAAALNPEPPNPELLNAEPLNAPTLLWFFNSQLG
jgi:hypothetical protein